MKTPIEMSKQWCMKMAELEGDQEIGAGSLAIDPCFEIEDGNEIPDHDKGRQEKTARQRCFWYDEC